MGLFIKAGAPGSGRGRQDSRGFPGPDVEQLLGNLVPVTIDNIIGGSVMVAAVYWLVYLRKTSA